MQFTHSGQYRLLFLTNNTLRTSDLIVAPRLLPYDNIQGITDWIYVH